MPQRVAYVNGRFVPESEACVSIFDRGFLSGYGVFERTRTFNGEPFKLDAHLARLDLSLRMTRLELGMSLADLKAQTLEVLSQNLPLREPRDDYSIGHYVSLGAGGKPTVVIFTLPIPFAEYARQYLDGGHVVTPSTRQVPVESLDPKMKTTSRIYFHLAEAEAHAVDPEAYALLLDGDGNVCEVSPGANFWIVRNGTLITPPGRSILRGITRDALMEVAAVAGVPVVEQEFQTYDVVNADEACLTTTSRCVLPVTKINGLPIRDGKPGPIIGRLQNAWAEHFRFDFVGQALSYLPEAAAVHAG
jgi:branched-chain amino acid aminotransferase